MRSFEDEDVQKKSFRNTPISSVVFLDPAIFTCCLVYKYSMKGILCLCFIISLVCVTECAYRGYSSRRSRYYSYYGGGGSLSTGGIIGLCVGLTVGIAVIVVVLLCYLNVIKKPTCCVPKSKVGSHNAVTYSSNPVTTSHQAPTDPVTHPPPPAPDMSSSYPPAYTSPYPPPPYGYDPQSQPMKN